MPDSYKPTDTERTRGIITSSDREYLLGHLDVEPQSQRERVIRGRIRERVRQALVDFSLLFRHLEDRDLHGIFDEESIPEDRRPDTAPRPISLGAAHAVGLFYRDEPDSFESFIEAAVELELREQGWLADPEVKVEANRQMNAEEILERVKATDEIWPKEKEILENEGLIDPEALSVTTHHYHGSRDDGIPDGITSPEEAIEYLSLPARGESDREEQREAVKGAVRLLRRKGETTTEEIRDTVYPLYPGGYGDRDSWVAELMLPALEALPGIDVRLRGKVVLTDTPDTEDQE